MGSTYEFNVIFWVNIFYLSKYYELLDTIFLVLRKKQLTVLHVYHHAVVVLICYYAVRDEIMMGWITVFQNAFVHSLMYAYYAGAIVGYRPWWAKYLTQVQMVQFVSDSVTSLPFPLILTSGYRCNGSMSMWLASNFCGWSFFVLFLNYYRIRYNQAKASKRPTRGRK